jgi:Domain of unknown function (DUF5615)
MLLRLLIDQDFDHDILRGLVRRVPDLDAVTAHEAKLAEAPDPELLAWAAESGRIVVTHDRKTMPGHAANRVAVGERMPGVFVVPHRLPVGQVIDDLELMVTCSDENQWENITRYLPL